MVKNGNDPVIGVRRASYGGAISLLAAGLDPRVDAIVPAFTWNSLSQALFPQYRVGAGQQSPADVTPVGHAGRLQAAWASLLFRGAGAGRPRRRQRQPGLRPVHRRALLGLPRGGRDRGDRIRRLIKLLDESGPAELLAKITAPTLIIQGEDDTLFPLDQADANLRGLPADTPAR